MKKPDKIPCRQLKAGFELPCQSYKIKAAMITDYLEALGEKSSLYQKDNSTPPMAVASFAMNAIADSIDLPPGVVHTHGEIEFLGRAKACDVIDCRGKVESVLKRGNLNFLTIDFSIQKQGGSQILRGKTSLIIPADE